MPEGKDYITFRKVGNKSKTKVTSEKTDENYQFWCKKYGIETDPKDVYSNTFEMVSGMFGNHTFPFKIYLADEDEYTYPIIKIFEPLNDLYSAPGLLSNKKRGIIGDHMGTATQLGLDSLVFSYMGIHDPYHRLHDPPPQMPFGFFLDVGEFAYTHGTPWDRDYKNNSNVVPEEIQYYFLKHEDLKKLITWRIENDDIFKKDFWTYFGTSELWNDPDYLKSHWKNKAELCFHLSVPPQYISAILWPVWEAGTINEEFTPDELQEFASDLKDQYKNSLGKEISIIMYRPLGEIVNEASWQTENLLDMELNVIKASEAVQRYYDKHKKFPEDVLNLI